MPKRLQVSLSAEEVEAVAKALELAGVGSGDSRRLVQSFANMQLANAAKRARNILRDASGQSVLRSRQAREKLNAEIFRDIEEPTVEESLRERNRELADDVRSGRRFISEIVDRLGSIQRALNNEHYERADRELAELAEACNRRLQ